MECMIKPYVSCTQILEKEVLNMPSTFRNHASYTYFLTLHKISQPLLLSTVLPTEVREIKQVAQDDKARISVKNTAEFYLCL